MFGELLCKLVSMSAHIFGYGSWMALSIIAVVRVLAVWTPNYLRNICTDRGSKIIIIAQWMFVILLLLPSFFEVSKYKYFYESNVNTVSANTLLFIDLTDVWIQLL